MISSGGRATPAIIHLADCRPSLRLGRLGINLREGGWVAYEPFDWSCAEWQATVFLWDAIRAQAGFSPIQDRDCLQPGVGGRGR